MDHLSDYLTHYFPYKYDEALFQYYQLSHLVFNILLLKVF